MAENSNNLTYSENGKKNRKLFLKSLNEVNIYVEDSGKEYVYQGIFSKLFGREMRFGYIEGLGGKSRVLEEISNKGQYDENGRPNIFIVDGDFDNIWDDNKTDCPYLIYLDKYNIESYYFSKDSVINALIALLEKVSSDVEALLDYDRWLNDFVNDSGKLFELFAIAKKYCEEIPNVKTSKDYLDRNGDVIEEEYLKYESKLVAKLKNLEPYKEIFKSKLNKNLIGTEKEKLAAIICGKYQLDSLCRRISARNGKQVPRPYFEKLLRSEINPEPLYFLKERILQIREESRSKSLRV